MSVTDEDMADSAEYSEWLSVAEACEFLSVGKTILYEYMSTGALPFFVLAGKGHRRVKKHDLIKLLVPGKSHFDSPSPEDTKWLKVSEAGAYIKVTKQTLYTYMSEDRLPYYYLTGTHHRRIKKGDLDALYIPGNPEEREHTDSA